ncbi:FadR family transcriptional regulator [Sphingomonas sp. AP4-R1]|uniref:FadR/GntR family transcriptional regulator n=1 Tax=Sphingomonas sp. AP4-R1 TaxID=2735134 RepID=UPI0014935296|nr:FadR/GntR family transcriptional regulator [Sphingomonas sp. AP4-R1]QJU60740.1 FadR family transcriptional regulator [Sphingomonas sp. AP4-R1]
MQADRLYQRLARQLFDELAAGRYEIGARLPAERELATLYNVSRPAVREAMIALEVQGLIEVKVGSGAYVRRLPGSKDHPDFHATAFELTEARLVFEGEAAALAAMQIGDAELDALDALVDRIARENEEPQFSDKADHEFHLLIARASRNAVIADTVERLWQMRSNSPDCALLHEKARTANIRPDVDEHAAIARALRARDPEAARGAMRAHLGQVMDYLLFTTEERAIAQARRSVASTRARFGRTPKA